MLPATITEFSGLIRWIAERHHGGRYYPMALRLKISVALIYQWKDGAVRQPEWASLDRLCRTYDLDPMEIMGLIWKLPQRPTSPRKRPLVRPIAGGAGAAALPTPCRADESPEPQPPSDNGGGRTRPPGRRPAALCKVPIDGWYPLRRAA